MMILTAVGMRNLVVLIALCSLAPETQAGVIGNAICNSTLLQHPVLAASHASVVITTIAVCFGLGIAFGAAAVWLLPKAYRKWCARQANGLPSVSADVTGRGAEPAVTFEDWPNPFASSVETVNPIV